MAVLHEHLPLYLLPASHSLCTVGVDLDLDADQLHVTPCQNSAPASSLPQSVTAQQAAGMHGKTLWHHSQ